MTVNSSSNPVDPSLSYELAHFYGLLDRNLALTNRFDSSYHTVQTPGTFQVVEEGGSVGGSIAAEGATIGTEATVEGSAGAIGGLFALIPIVLYNLYQEDKELSLPQGTITYKDPYDGSDGSTIQMQANFYQQDIGGFQSVPVDVAADIFFNALQTNPAQDVLQLMNVESANPALIGSIFDGLLTKAQEISPYDAGAQVDKVNDLFFAAASEVLPNDGADKLQEWFKAAGPSSAAALYVGLDSRIDSAPYGLEEALQNPFNTATSEYLTDLPAQDAAQFISEVSTDQAAAILSSLEPESSAAILQSMVVGGNADQATQIVQAIADTSATTAANIVSKLNPATAGDILSKLEPEVSKAILDEMLDSDAAAALSAMAPSAVTNIFAQTESGEDFNRMQGIVTLMSNDGNAAAAQQGFSSSPAADSWADFDNADFDAIDTPSPEVITYGTTLPFRLQDAPEATPISPSLGIGDGLENGEPEDMGEDFDLYFQSFASETPYTVSQVSTQTTNAELDGIWNALSTADTEVKFVINSNGNLVVGASLGTDGLKHSVLANYVPGMEDWTPELRYQYLTAPTVMTNNNIVTGGELTLRQVGDGHFELGYDNASGHYQPGANTLWNAQVRTSLNDLATMLGDRYGVDVTVGMQTDQIIP